MQLITYNKIQLLKPELGTIGVCLSVLSNLIDRFPFWITGDGFRKFEQSRKVYQEVRDFYESIVFQLNDDPSADVNNEEWSHHCENACLNRKGLSTYLASVFETCLSELKNTEFISKINEFISDCGKSEIRLNQLYHSTSSKAVEGNEISDYLKGVEGFEKSFSKFMRKLNKHKDRLLTSFHTRQFLQENSCFVTQLQDPSLDACLDLQHEIYVFQELLKHFDWLSKKDFELKFMPPISLKKIKQVGWMAWFFSRSPFLLREYYTDLVLLTDILKPKKVDVALTRKRAFLQFHYDRAKKKIPFLQERFESCLSEAIRLQRTIMVYQEWDKEISNIKPNLKNITEVEKLLTYQKKSFLREQFSKQRVPEVVQALCDFVKTTSLKENPEWLCFGLRVDKDDLYEDIKEKEDKIKKEQSYLQSLFSTLLLGVTQHPEYQLGYSTTKWVDRFLTKSSGVSQWKKKTPPLLLDCESHMMGSIFFTVGLSFSRWIGYSYQTVSTISRLPLAQIDQLIWIFSSCDIVSRYVGLPLLEVLEQFTPNQLSGISDWSKKAIRFDELSVVTEKEAMMQWIAGLGISIVLYGGYNIVPIISAYSIATGCRKGAGYLAGKIARECGMSSTREKVLKTTAHIGAFSLTYSYGFNLGFWLSPPKINLSEISQAYKLYNLPTNASKQDIERKFRELSLKYYYPDKGEDEQKWIDIDNAHDLLKKEAERQYASVFRPLK